MPDVIISQEMHLWIIFSLWDKPGTRKAAATVILVACNNELGKCT